MVKNMIKLGTTLFLIAFLTTALLAFVNHTTSSVIESNTIAAENSSREELIDADDFLDIGDGIYEGTKNEKTSGYCVNVSPVSKYGGEMQMMVGINNDMSVTGIKIISHNETPGLGANATDPEFTKKLIGKKHPVNVNKNGNSDENQIDAISGATLTSQAVADGINEAFEKIKAKGLGEK